MIREKIKFETNDKKLFDSIAEAENHILDILREKLMFGIKPSVDSGDLKYKEAIKIVERILPDYNKCVSDYDKLTSILGF